MLEPQVPVTEDQLRQLQGLPVCIVMNDGTRHFGTITGCAKGKVVLNGIEDDSAAEDDASARAGRKAGKNRNGRRAGSRIAKTARSRSKAEGDGTADEPPLQGANGWGYFGLGPPPMPPFGPKVVLPIKPIDAVLLL